jgi:hypothetical protein
LYRSTSRIECRAIFSILRLAVCFALLLTTPLFERRPADANQTFEGSASELVASKGVVFVQARENGSGFAILNYGGYTYFLSAAHLLDQEEYAANASLEPGNPGRRGDDEWLSIKSPSEHSGRSYKAEIVGAPAFMTGDLLLFRVANMDVVPRPLCLGEAVPELSTFGIESFTIGTLYERVNGSPRTHPIEVAGVTAPQADDVDFEFTGPAEQGFSGSPLVVAQDATVVGIVKSSELTTNPNGGATGTSIVSVASHLAVSPRQLSAFLMNRLPAAAYNFLAQRRNLGRAIDFSAAWRVRLLLFDAPLVAEGTEMDDRFRAIEGRLESTIQTLFQRDADLGADVRRWPTQLPVGTDMVQLDGKICEDQGEELPGAIGVRRQIVTTTTGSSIEGRVALIDCEGNIIASVDMQPTPIGESVSPDQIRLFGKNFSDALIKLSGFQPQRLMNFAIDGLPMTDTELRGFFRMDQTSSGPMLSSAWQHGLAFDRFKLAAPRKVLSIDGVSQNNLRNMNSDQLETLLQSGQPRAVQLAGGGGSDSSSTVMLGSVDRCFYLMRRQQMTSDGSIHLHDLFRQSVL